MAGRAGGAPRCQLLSGRRGVNTLDRSSDTSDTDTTWTWNNCNVTHGSDLNMASTVTLLAGMLTLITKSSSGFLIKISEDVSTQNCQEVLSNLEVGLLKICYIFSTSSTRLSSSPCCVCVLCSLCCGETESHFSRASAEQDPELETRCWRWRPAAAAAAGVRSPPLCKYLCSGTLEIANTGTENYHTRTGYIGSKIASQRTWI